MNKLKNNDVAPMNKYTLYKIKNPNQRNDPHVKTKERHGKGPYRLRIEDKKPQMLHTMQTQLGNLLFMRMPRRERTDPNPNRNIIRMLNHAGMRMSPSGLYQQLAQLNLVLQLCLLVAIMEPCHQRFLCRCTNTSTKQEHLCARQYTSKCTLPLNTW